MTKARKGPGAPAFVWTEEIEDEIFRRIAEGESLRSICEDDWLPSARTVYKRLSEDPAFAQHYTRAREDQADRIFDEVQEIADAAAPDTVAVARLQIDTRKWRAGKLRPKVYGDKLELAGDPERPLVHTIERRIVKAGD